MDPESSVELLRRFRAGEVDALNRLLARYVGPLRRWAHGRLPQGARDLSDTQDLVQDALVRTLGRLDAFEPVGPAALHWYLRQAVMNRIRDELRRARRRPPPAALDERLPHEAASPLEVAIGRETVTAYITALGQLSTEDHELVIARVECGFDYGEIAAMFDKPTAAAARMAVRRALVRLAARMRPARAGGSAPP